MTITLANFRAQLNYLLYDVVSGTTTATGDANKLTLIDTTELVKYKDDYFVDWYAFVPSANEERMVSKSLTPEGTITVHAAFTAQVASSTAYELHKFAPSDKKIAINNALHDVFILRDYYQRIYDTTLWGQMSYGEEPDEFNKNLFTVPVAFIDFPEEMWIQESYIGAHTGSDDASVLTDSSQGWETNELAGLTILNKTDGSSATVTSNTSTTVTGSLSGGTDNDWDTDDEYIVPRPDRTPEPLKNYRLIDKANRAGFTFYANIPERYTIILLGAIQLSQFGNEASTTELTTEQARVVAHKAAANMYGMLASRVTGQNTDEYRKAEAYFEQKYRELARVNRMPVLGQRKQIDWSWAR